MWLSHIQVLDVWWPVILLPLVCSILVTGNWGARFVLESTNPVKTINNFLCLAGCMCSEGVWPSWFKLYPVQLIIFCMTKCNIFVRLIFYNQNLACNSKLIIISWLTIKSYSYIIKYYDSVSQIQFYLFVIAICKRKIKIVNCNLMHFCCDCNILR